MSTHEINLTNYQWDMLHTKEKHVLLLGGIGTGKSFTLAHQAINLVASNPGINILIVANTYSQLINATVKTLVDILDQLNIPFDATLGGSKKQIKIGRSIIYLYSLENYNAIRGIEVGALLCDEIAYSSREAVNVCLGRLRQKNMPLIARYYTSPNGFNYLYDMFIVDKNRQKKIITATIFDNPYLPEEYKNDLIQQYGGIDSPLAKQELLGQFQNLSAGSIYWAFNREKHVLSNLRLDKNYPVYVGIDFNVGNMSAVYIQYIQGKFILVKEVSQTDNTSNTFSLAEQILKDLNGYNILVVPDSTGKSRKSSSAKTDHQILKDYGLQIVDSHNPFIRDRQNNVNNQFTKNQLVIDSTCTKTIREIETLSSRDDEGKVVHLSVCLGYVISKLDPIIKRRTSQDLSL